MNSLIEQELPGIHDLRDQLLDLIADQDLTYKLPGDNLTLGELCVEMAHIQQVYIDSFTTLTLDWDHHDTPPTAANSVAILKNWYAQLDAELIAAVRDFSEEDIRDKQIDRGEGFTPSPYVQFQLYREALLIFYAKASVYLKALGKPFTAQWKSWIG